eukprot:Hpha_TRINITY_DN8538_c0_g2::TRINITY_DN8538_c0_g2_i1::g.146399::m.146399
MKGARKKEREKDDVEGEKENMSTSSPPTPSWPVTSASTNPSPAPVQISPALSPKSALKKEVSIAGMPERGASANLSAYGVQTTMPVFQTTGSDVGALVSEVGNFEAAASAHSKQDGVSFRFDNLLLGRAGSNLSVSENDDSRALRRLFEEGDANCDGTFSCAELHSFLIRQGFRIGLEEVR